MTPPNHYRAIWLADVRLGTPACETSALLDFLHGSESEYLYLVGDIVGAEAFKQRRSWDAPCNDVVAEVLRKARQGTRVAYLPGDEDAFVREWLHCGFGGITVQPHAIHVTADDRHLLVLHGDQLDRAARWARWLAHLGAQRWARRLSRWYRHAGTGEHMAGFEAAVAAEARTWDVDGVVCGHVRRAALRTAATGLLYANPGDWTTDRCTALVEHAGGQLELLRWPASPLRAVVPSRAPSDEEKHAREADPPRRAPFLAPSAEGGAA